MRSAAIGLAAVCALGLATAGAWAQSPFGFSRAPDDAPALIDAASIVYDRQADRLTATGGVTIVQGARALSAERIEYFLAEDRIVASGGVTLLEPGGEVASAERVVLTDRLKRAVADRLALRLADGSRLVGRQVERVAGTGATLVDGAFTPCRRCAENPDRPPIWRLRARKVEHDEIARDINYEDVTLDIAGVPVAYLPYFSHPDPTVKRRTGFLAPSLFFGGEFDAVAQIPYYWSIAPNRDLTFQPFLTVKSAPVAAAEYRHLFANGAVRLDGSIGVLDRTTNSGNRAKDTTRGHAFAQGDFALDETWRFTFDGKIASDDSYLETFNIDDSDVLRSLAAVEGFWRQTYVRVGGYGVQDLRDTASQNDTPFALPEAEAAFFGAPGPYGAAFGRIDGRVLGRERGTDGQSASATVGWRTPLVTTGGHRFDLEASLRGDVYNTQDGAAVGAGGADTAARAAPRLVAGWRYPLVQQNRWGSLIVEPRLQAVFALDDARNRGIPNEDSRAIEYDESNFFEPDRFPGRDVIDDGQRLDYGLSATALFAGGGRAYGFIGQSVARKPGDFAAASGMDGRSSDIVAALTATPAPWLDLVWRGRMAKDDLAFRRQEIGVVAGPEWLRVDAAYVDVDSSAQGPESSSAAEQVKAAVALRIDENWRVEARHHRDLAAADPLLWGASLAYGDECLSVDVGFTRNFASRADGGGREDSIFLRVSFKHLGGLGVSQGLGDRDDDGQQ